MFERAGVPVFDADAVVRDLQANDPELIAAIGRRFPGTVAGGVLDRDRLSRLVLGYPAELAALEAIVHPEVQEARAKFHRGESRTRRPCCSTFHCCSRPVAKRRSTRSSSSPPADTIQRQRVLARPGMTDEKLDAILARQMPDEEKRRRADFVVDTGIDLSTTERQVGDILYCLGISARPIEDIVREIVFDTETTGLNPAGGDRMVEIGCIEMINRVETGRHFHAYFNPLRVMPAEAEAVHGLSNLFLSDQPLFEDRVEELIEFLGDAPLVAHNASFDFGFLNHELQRCGRPIVCMSRMVDTLVLARARHPGAKHSLDALCARFGVDRSMRVKHGALLDAQLLAQVYVELTGGRQIGLGLVADTDATGCERQRTDGNGPRAPRSASALCERGGTGAASCVYRTDGEPALGSLRVSSLKLLTLVGCVPQRRAARERRAV